MNVCDTIGYAAGFGELIVEIARSGGIVIPSAAAEVAASVGSDELAGAVLHRGVREAVLQRVRLLDVADRAVRLLDRRGDARVALGAGAGRPLDDLVGLPAAAVHAGL